jgi:hypothetical protein
VCDRRTALRVLVLSPQREHEPELKRGVVVRTGRSSGLTAPRSRTQVDETSTYVKQTDAPGGGGGALGRPRRAGWRGRYAGQRAGAGPAK